jgi:hypothetical protein
VFPDEGHDLHGGPAPDSLRIRAGSSARASEGGGITGAEPSPPGCWRQWVAGALALLTSLSALLREFGVVSHEELARTGAVTMGIVGAIYGARAYVHVRIGYVRRPGAATTAVEAGKRRGLATLVVVDAVLAVALMAVADWFFFNPNNWTELGTVVVVIAAVALSSDCTIRLADALGLPRGSEVVENCDSVRWLREFAEHFGSVPGVLKLDSLWGLRTLPHRVSGLVIVLLVLLAGVALGQGVAVLPAVKDYLSRPATIQIPRKDESESATGIGAKIKSSTRSRSLAGDPSSLPRYRRSYEELCGGAITPGEIAPGHLNRELESVWEEFGGVVAGCAERTRLVPGSSGVYYVAGQCAGEFRSLAVSGPMHGAEMLLNQPAVLARSLALDGKLRGASPRLPIGPGGSGDFQIVYTTEGSYVAIREQETDGHGGPAREPLNCEELTPALAPYVVVPPALAALWIKFEELERAPVWPSQNSSDATTAGQLFSFDSADEERTTVASASCVSPTVCKVTSGDLTLRSSQAPAEELLPERIERWGP